MKELRNISPWLSSIFLYAGAISIFILSIPYFQHRVTGIIGGKPVEDELWYAIALRIHIIGGMIAIFLGPTQFIASLRRRYMNWHRRLGTMYFMSVFASGLAGLIVARYAIGGLVSTLGFTMLASLWIITGLIALTSINKGDVKRHQKWMYYNYALTFSAIPQRTMLALALITPIPFVNIYQASAWISWILNLLIAYFIIKQFVKD